MDSNEQYLERHLRDECAKRCWDIIGEDNEFAHKKLKVRVPLPYKNSDTRVFLMGMLSKESIDKHFQIIDAMGRDPDLACKMDAQGEAFLGLLIMGTCAKFTECLAYTDRPVQVDLEDFYTSRSPNQLRNYESIGITNLSEGGKSPPLDTQKQIDKKSRRHTHE